MRTTVATSKPVHDASGKALHPERPAATRRHGFPGNQAMLRTQAPTAGRGVPGIQAKLRVGAVDDPSEREADRIADQIMRMPNPSIAATPVLGAADGPLIRRKCAACEEEEKGQLLQTKPLGTLKASPTLGEAPPIVHDVLRSPGRPLDASTRSFYERIFGRDMRSVRIHADRASAAAAHSLNARAFTVGTDVVFEANEFAPGSQVGKALLAHELTHVLQQSDGVPSLRRKALTEEEKKEDLKSPRFAANKRLQDAFDNNPPLRKGEPDKEAVRLLQQALIDDLCLPGSKKLQGECHANLNRKGDETSRWRFW